MSEMERYDREISALITAGHFEWATALISSFRSVCWRDRDKARGMVDGWKSDLCAAADQQGMVVVGGDTTPMSRNAHRSMGHGKSGFVGRPWAV